MKPVYHIVLVLSASLLGGALFYRLAVATGAAQDPVVEAPPPETAPGAHRPPQANRPADDEPPERAEPRVASKPPDVPPAPARSTDPVPPPTLTLGREPAPARDPERISPTSPEPAPGTGSGRASESPPGPRPEAGTGKTYTVRSGDTFGSIAVNLYGTERAWSALARANPRVDPARPEAGQTLRLPDEATLSEALENPLPPPGEVIEHRVREGETLGGIALRYYGSTRHWRMLFRHNRGEIGSKPEHLRPGMTLTIPPLPDSGDGGRRSSP